MLLPLDGPSSQVKLVSVGTGTVVEVKASGTRLEGRKVVTIQPISQKIYVYFGDGISTPSSATVSANGFIHYKAAKESYEAGDAQPVYILSVASTTDVIIVERA